MRHLDSKQAAKCGAASVSKLTAACCFSLLLGFGNAAIAADASWSSSFSAGNDALQAGRPAVAVQNFRKALSLAQKQPKNVADIDKCKIKLATTLTLTGKVAEARSLLLAMQASIQKTEGANSSRMRAVLMELGSIQEAAGNHSVAMDYYNRALQISEKNYGPYTPEAAAAFRGLGSVNRKLGNKAASSSNYEKAISILSNDPNRESADELKRITHEYTDLIKGDDNSDNSLIKDFQKDILKNNGSGDKPSGGGTPKSDAGGGSSLVASQFQKQSDFKLGSLRSADTAEDTKLDSRSFSMPSSDVTLQPAFKVLNDTIVDQNRYRGSLEQYERMIATDIDSLGPNHPSVGNDLRGLAQLLIAQGRYQEAKPLLVKALAVYEGAYGSKNVVSISTAVSLALTEGQLGNKEQAINIYNKQLVISQESLGPGNIETAKILNALGYLYFQQGQLDKSSSVYESALASTKQAVGDKDPLMAACLRDYAQVLRRLNKDSKASELELQAGQIVGQ